MKELKDAHASKNIAQIDAAMEKINNAWSAASEDMYKAQQEAAGGAQPGPDAAQGGANQGQKPEDTVTDVDYEEVK